MKVINLLNPRRADVELYLAASSLGNQHEEPEEENVEIAMRDDLMLLAEANAALPNYAESISALKLLRMLKCSYSADELSEIMKERWKKLPELKSHLLMIPMLIEASN